MTRPDPLREAADRYTALNDVFIAEVTFYRQMLAMAGHRTTDRHDCFLMNCRTLAAEVRDLREKISTLDAALHDGEQS